MSRTEAAEPVSPPAGRRPQTRPDLSRGVRALYGLGLAAEGVKTNAFNLFLLFYYQQVAGLDAVTTGLALLIALFFDAVADPIVGMWSDGFRSRLGRRHPFMYAASLPLAASFYGVFNPPAGAGQGVLFAWLVFFACATRFSMSLFVIPHQALVAELTHDYDARTRLQSGRTVFAWLFGLLNALLAYTVFLTATDEYPYDPAGFPAFALWGAAIMTVTTVLSSLGTQRAAVAAQPEEGSIKHIRVRDLYAEVRGALGSANYRAAVIGGMLGAVGFGLAESLGNYMNLFFWGFKAQELAVFILVIAVASVVVLGAAPGLAGRFGKGRVAMMAALVAGAVTPAMVVFKLVGWLPPAGSSALLGVLCISVFASYSSLIIGFVMVGAMIADITDEHELRTGARQEGLLFAAMMLISKAASGLAPLVAGIVIELSGFPDDAKPGAVEPGIIVSLGVFAAVFALVIGVLTTIAYSRYGLTRQGHANIVAELNERQEAMAPQAQAAAAE